MMPHGCLLVAQPQTVQQTDMSVQCSHDAVLAAFVVVQIVNKQRQSENSSSSSGILL